MRNFLVSLSLVRFIKAGLALHLPACSNAVLQFVLSFALNYAERASLLRQITSLHA